MGRKQSTNFLLDPEAENRKHIVSHYMCNMKEVRNIYTVEHRHTQTQSHTPEEKRTHGNHFHGVIIDGSMIAFYMKYEGID